MRRFLKYTSLFAAMVIAALLAGEYIITLQPNPYSCKHRWMAGNASSVECLVLGSSHTFYGIDPAHIGYRTFNMANVSQNFEYDNILLRKYAPQCVNLHTVVIPVSYFSLFDKDLENGGESWLVTNYEKYMDTGLYPFCSRYKFELSHFPMYRNKLKGILKGVQPVECDTNGFGIGYSVERRSSNWKDDVHIAVERHTAPDAGMLEYNTGHLCRILDYCREMGLRAVLVTTPVWHGYHEALDSVQLEKMYAVAGMLVAKYGVEYYDFMCDGRFADDDFFDGDHLSTGGAAKFSKILSAILIDNKTRDR